MSNAGFVFGAWGAVLVAVGSYAVSLVVRGRRLVRRVRAVSGTGEE